MAHWSFFFQNYFDYIVPYKKPITSLRQSKPASRLFRIKAKDVDLHQKYADPDPCHSGWLT